MWFTSLKKKIQITCFCLPMDIWVCAFGCSSGRGQKRVMCSWFSVLLPPPSDFNPMHVQLNGGIRWQIRISSLRVSSFCRHLLCLPLVWQAVLYEWGHSQKGRMNSTPPLHLSLRWGRQQSAAESALASSWHHYAPAWATETVAFSLGLPLSHVCPPPQGLEARV